MPIVNGKYVAPTWKNGAAPAIDATELQAMSDSIQNRNGGVKTEIARFTSSGTWTVPSGITKVDAYVVGGGGAGGSYSASGSSGRGGGGGGGYCKLYKNITVTPGTNVSIVVGTGGEGGLTNTPTAGGTSWFKSSTYSAAGGQPGIASGNSAKGGDGGSGGGGINGTGGVAGEGGKDGAVINYGGKGGGNINYTPINPYDGIMYGCGGANGSSKDPGGGACSRNGVGIGAGGFGAGDTITADYVNGGVGGGGGGGCYRTSSTIYPSGNGGSGIVIIYG